LGIVILALSVAMAAPGASETPVPPGVWSVDGGNVLSIHSQQGLTVVVRVREVGVPGSGAPAQFAVGTVLDNGTGFLAPLYDPATFHDTGKRLGLTFKATNPTRLTATVTDGGAGAVEAVFSGTKVFPVSGFDVSAFGDSITFGVGAQSPGGYPARLQALLDGQGLPLSVTNAGLSGETAFAGASRLPAVLDGSMILPGIVLLLEGINGLDTDESTIDATVAALLDMVGAVRARGGLPILGTLTPVGPEDGRAAAVAALSARIRQVASQQGIRLADHEAAFGGNLGLLSGDQLHPNDAGYQRMAETWLAAILAAW
jgi:acyl-CoA thioesterase-1